MRDKLNEYAVLVEYWDILNKKHIKKWHYVKCAKISGAAIQIEQIIGSLFEILQTEEC